MNKLNIMIFVTIKEYTYRKFKGFNYPVISVNKITIMIKISD